MDLKDKIVLAHAGFFNKESKKIYRENSKEVCAISASKDYINIIELDVRKSKDGILYCYHGNFFQYYLTLRFAKNFDKIKYKVDKLADILKVINKDKIIFLDIKDKKIKKEDIIKVFKGLKFKEVILGNKSPVFLKRFNGLPEEFVKIINGNLLCSFYDMQKLKADKFKYFEVVLPIQVTRKIVREVEGHDMGFRFSGLFVWSNKTYWNRIQKYDIKQVSSDFIS